MDEKKKTGRVIGTQTYINSNTGEFMDFQVIAADDNNRDNNFHKLFLDNFVNVLDAIGNQKTKVFTWIIRHRSKDNLLLYSYRQIADKTGISYATVAETMEKLISADFLRRHSSGYYMVNPCVLFKGSMQRRHIAMGEYGRAGTDSRRSADERRLRQIRQDISRLRRQENSILMNMDIDMLEQADTSTKNRDDKQADISTENQSGK